MLIQEFKSLKVQAKLISYRVSCLSMYRRNFRERTVWEIRGKQGECISLSLKQDPYSDSTIIPRFTLI